MDKLRQLHTIRVNKQEVKFIRHLYNKFPWNEKLTGIKGFRGVGKTTMILQYIKNQYALSDNALYVSLDDLYFTENRLIDVVESFVVKGGEHIFIDEVHKYNNWAIELKNIYDTYDIKITFTGSSLLEILNSTADLSRRALVFNMQGLSFREYLALITDAVFPVFSLNDILNNHKEIAIDITSKLRVLKYYDDYLKNGYYPFSHNNLEFYHFRLREIINMVIDIEFPQLKHVEPSKTKKIKQLLYIIALSSPFKPNISKLASRIEVTRNTVNEYIKILAEAGLINLLNKNAYGINLLQKPDKIYLENTNISYALAEENPDKGNLRETFFLNQISNAHTITYPDKGDFLVDKKYLFEVGGKNKTKKQIAAIENSFIVADDIEFGHENKIPLWLFGFLY